MHLIIYYKTTKPSTYFQLKCSTLFELSVNVAHKFSCQCNTTLSYIGYTARCLVTRAREHLNFNAAAKSAFKDLVYSCPECIEKHLSVYDFTVLKKRHTEHEAKIQEALAIKSKIQN